MICNNELCHAMALCDSCFDAKEAEGATQVASPPKKRKKSCLLNLSSEEGRLHANQLKVNHTLGGRKQRQRQTMRRLLLKVQHECGKLDRLKQESEARCEKLRSVIENTRSVIENT